MWDYQIKKLEKEFKNLSIPQRETIKALAIKLNNTIPYDKKYKYSLNITTDMIVALERLSKSFSLICCGQKMQIFSSEKGNGWQCKICNYIHWDLASCED